MDLVSPACSSGQEFDIVFMDEESIRLVMASLSPPRPWMLTPWSPPPSPPASVGFGGPWNFDDIHISPLETALIPAQASERPRAWRPRTWRRGNWFDLGYERPRTWLDLGYERPRTWLEWDFEGYNTDSPMELEPVSSKWHLHAPLHDGSTDGSCLLKERLTHALQHLKESTDSCLLAQVWETVEHEGRHVLTTSGQPFMLSNQNTGLFQFRDASMMHILPPDSTNAGELGVTGRIFRFKVPEWSPSGQRYSSEYPLPDQALHYDVRATFALPVFDPHTKSCAVVQLMMLTEKMDFEPEVDLMCKGLEAVNLTSTYMPSRPSAQILNHSRQSALVDILGILTFICRTHKLPLAQTWVPCCNDGTSTSHAGSVNNTILNLDGCCAHGASISTCDVAFHVADAHMWGFRDACVKHHLQKGQGVAGDAFVSNKPCFSKDVSQLSGQEYPLAHYAHMFGLAACVAVCLQSSYTGDDVYILEFFLPPDCREDGEQKALLESIYALMKQNLRSLKVSTSRDFGSPQLNDLPATGNGELKETDTQNPESRHCELALVLDRSKRMRGNTENAAHSINAPRSKSKSKSKSRSIAWEHFKREDGARAICNYCKKVYAADTTHHGTSHLLRHLKDAHGIDPKASSSESRN